MLGIVAPLVVLAVIFVALEIVVRTTGISEYILPAPSKIFLHTIQQFPVDIWPHCWLTLKVILIGFTAATFGHADCGHGFPVQADYQSV